MVFFVVDCSTRKVKIVRISNGFGRHIRLSLSEVSYSFFNFSIILKPLNSVAKRQQSG